MYLHGYGVSRDIGEAIRYSKAGADHGSIEGQLNMGRIHFCKQKKRKTLFFF